MVDMALEQIQAKNLEKVVLARKQIIELKGRVSPVHIFDQIRQYSSKHNYEFYLQTSPDTAFISATPERLFELRGNTIKTEALAGTRPRGNNPQEDKHHEDELRQHPKERHEHELFLSFLKKALEQISRDVTCHPTQIVKLSHVQHLQTSLEGVIPPTSNNLEKILSLLHPTPGVAGCPSEKALPFINQQESFQRGLYAAPIGVVQKDHAHFATAIRSALFHHNKLHLYAGAGIVNDSQGNQEWKETQSKMQMFQELF